MGFKHFHSETKSTTMESVFKSINFESQTIPIALVPSLSMSGGAGRKTEVKKEKNICLKLIIY